MIESQLLLDFHREHFQRLVTEVIGTIQGLRPGGLFAGVVRCKTLWDEAAWALQMTEDTEAQVASRDVFAQIAWGTLRDISDQQLCIHAYFLGDETGPDWMPLPEKESLVEVIVAEVSAAALAQPLDGLERI